MANCRWDFWNKVLTLSNPKSTQKWAKELREKSLDFKEKRRVVGFEPKIAVIRTFNALDHQTPKSTQKWAEKLREKSLDFKEKAPGGGIRTQNRGDQNF